MIRARVSNNMVEKTFNFKIWWVKTLSDHALVIFIIIILGHEYIVNSPLNPSFFSSELIGCQRWVKFRIHKYIFFPFLNLHYLVQILETWVHNFANRLILRLFIKITSHKNWKILIISIEKLFDQFSLSNSLLHLWRLCYKMCFTKYKLKAIIWFQAEYTVHEKLRWAWLEHFLFGFQAIELFLFVKDSWCSFVICLLNHLVSISEITHDADKAKVSLNLTVGFSVNFTETDDIRINLCKVFFVKS